MLVMNPGFLLLQGSIFPVKCSINNYLSAVIFPLKAFAEGRPVNVVNG